MFRTSPKDYPFGNRPLRLYVRTVRIPLSFGVLKYLLLDLSTYRAPSVALQGQWEDARQPRSEVRLYILEGQRTPAGDLRRGYWLEFNSFGFSRM